MVSEKPIHHNTVDMNIVFSSDVVRHIKGPSTGILLLQLSTKWVVQMSNFAIKIEILIHCMKCVYHLLLDSVSVDATQTLFDS